MSEVGALIISLQAETAQFRQDMGKVKSDLADLKGGAGEAGDGMDFSMTKARGGMMLLENATGVRMPRALNTLIAQIPGVGAAFATMLPIIGVVAAIAVISRLIDKQQELKAKELEAGNAAEDLSIKLDMETRALTLTNLKLDDQIRKLEHKPAHNYAKEAIEENAKAMDEWAEKSLGDFGKIEGAALEADNILHLFKLAMLSTDPNSEAKVRQYAGALAMVTAEAEGARGATEALNKIPPTSPQYHTALVQAINATKGLAKATKDAATTAKEAGDTTAFILFTSQAAAAAHQVTNLNLQLEGAQKRIKAANLEQGQANLEPLQKQAELVKTTAAGEIAHNAALREQRDLLAETTAIGNDSKHTDPDKQLAAEITAHREEYESAVDFAQKELAEKQKVYDAEKAAAGTDEDKKKDLLKQWQNTLQASTDLQTKAWLEMNKKDVESFAQTQAEKKRLAQEVTDAINKEAEKQNAYDVKVANMELARAKEADSMILAAHQHAYAQLMKAEKTAENTHYMAVQNANARELAAIVGSGPKEIAAREAVYRKIEEENIQHENNMLKITEDEEKRKLHLVQQAEDKMADAVAKTAAKSIFEGKNMAQAFAQMGKQMLETATENVLKSILLGDMQQEKDAAHAAASQYKAVMAAVPFPANEVAAPVAAALTFAAVMGFAEGGDVPGSGNTDSVPAMLMPGETVVSKALTQQVKDNVGGGSSRGDTHNHLTYAPQVSAIDANGVEKMLKQHASVFQKHVNATLRKQNKRAS